MGGAVSSGENNDDLIDNLMEADYIKNTGVERVFRVVDRAFYYTDEFKTSAYVDEAWKQGNIHLSAPCIYSQVMESLELGDGMSFLNLGSGTGYLSTMAGLILGSRGTNHGIELHSDVIDYALERLQAFIKNNPAIDEYEFCVPQFKHGNCLSLASTNRLYDRVYCGAACPELYENYMKQILEVGGILVMPVNDHLLQIRRVEENNWTINSVLSVSFASLLLPAQEIAENITLPPTGPHNLQNLCRFKIRSVLRMNIQCEYPTLWRRSRKNPKERKPSQALRRCVLPLFQETDSDTDSVAEMVPDVFVFNDNESSSSSDVDDDGDGDGDGDDDEIDETMDDSIDQRSGVRKTESVRHDDDPTQMKREKLDNGTSNLCESASGASSSSHAAAEPSANSSNSPNEPCNSRPPSESCTGAGNNAGEQEEEPPATGAGNTARNSLSRIHLFAHSLNGGRERPTLVIFDRRLSEGCDSEDSKKDDARETVSDHNVDFSNVVPPQNFSFHMKTKLLDLPLPLALKSFLNYDRTF